MVNIPLIALNAQPIEDDEILLNSVLSIFTPAVTGNSDPPLEKMPDNENTHNFVKHIIEKILTENTYFEVPITEEETLYNSDHVTDTLNGLTVENPTNIDLEFNLGLIYWATENGNFMLCIEDQYFYLPLTDIIGKDEMIEIVYGLVVEGWPVNVFDEYGFDIRDHSDRHLFY